MKIQEAVATITVAHGTDYHRSHNIRDPKVVEKEGHIRPDGRHEVWHDERPQDAYERIFGEARRAYNAKQRRSDRKIGDYYAKVCKEAKRNDHKPYPVHELIVGVYHTGLPDDMCRRMLHAYYQDFKRRNPDMEVIGCYYHADEQGGAPHIHLDFIPVGRGYVQSLETQVSMARALEQQGYVTERRGKKEEGCQLAQAKWQDAEKDAWEGICHDHGIRNVVRCEKGKGKKHKKTADYKREMERQMEREVEMPQPVKINRWGAKVEQAVEHEMEHGR